MNFVHSNPLVCTSIGLAVNKKIIGGLVNCPIIGKLYTAVKGRGSYLNGTERLQSSGITKLRDAMILMELPSGANDTKKNTALANITMLMAEAHAVRCPGKFTTTFKITIHYLSCLCSIRSGSYRYRLDWFWVCRRVLPLRDPLLGYGRR